MNLATYLLLDGLDGLYESAVVISDDSDLEAPISRSEPSLRVRPRAQPARPDFHTEPGRKRRT